jgi:hypothetical protein
MPYSIIDVLANDILSPDCTAPVVTVTVQPKNGTATVNGDNKIEYAGNTPGLDSLTYRVTCGTQYSEAKVYITVDASAFVDDVWYWGQNSAGAGYGSPGIRFVKDSQGNYVPRDASGEASVYSHTSSLVVRSPYCDEVIFYASSNQLYNGFHNPIQNGSFDGASDICDGMASCYMGDNKYLFFFLTRNRELRAYVIDMNVNNGRGARIKEIIIEQASSNMAPSIELIVRAGTTDQYWLLYGHCQSGCSGNDNNEMRTRLVNVSDPDNPQIGNILFRTPKSLARTHKLKVSQQNNRVAITNIHIYTVDLYDFDNSTGQLSNRQTITGLLSHPVGIEFSPDGTQLYAATGNGNVARLFQYNISVTPPAHVGDVQYWTQNAIDHRGGGLKLGLDGKIYVVQSNTNKVGAISDPNSTASLATRYNSSALTLSVTGVLDLNFSTAITNPAIISCNTNSPPVTQADDTALCLSATSKTVKVNVLLNDNDADNDTIYLTNAEFLNKADADLATLTVNPADSTVTLTLKTDASVTVGYIFDIIYNVKDNGLPLSRCAAGSLKVKVSQMSYPDIRVRVCPDAGDISLAKYIDTVDNITDIQWAHQISGIPVSSPEGIISTGNLTFSRVHTLTYTVTSRCVSEQKRKVYLEVLKDGSMRPLKDTVAICYINAEAVQINQLFGIEAGGTWSYPSTAYITESTSPTYSGAVVMNGKGIYENDVSSIPFITYHGVKAKAVKFTYTTDIDGCLKGREYSIVVVLTEDMMK